MDGTEDPHWEKPPSISPGGSTSSGPDLCDPKMAAILAARLFGCFRLSEASDPQTFVAMATSVLARYPEQVVRRVCYGLPEETKWLPSIAEIKAACDRAMEGLAAPRPPRRSKPLDYVAEPWLMHAKVEIIDGQRFIPGHEVDRAWREWVKKKRAEADASKSWVKDKVAELFPAEASTKPATEATLDELSARYAAEPVTISEALRAKLAGDAS